MVLFSWASLLFIGKGNMKKFLPASIIIVLFEAINGLIGSKRNWWFFYNKPKNHFFNEFPFYIGPFFASSLWILRISFGDFKKFLLYNAILNATFAFPVAKFAKKIKYYTVRLNGFQFFIYYFYKAFILYGLQYFFQKNYKPVK